MKEFERLNLDSSSCDNESLQFEMDIWPLKAPLSLSKTIQELDVPELEVHPVKMVAKMVAKTLERLRHVNHLVLRDVPVDVNNLANLVTNEILLFSL